MKKERLGKLQKWILVRAYALGGHLSNKDIWEKKFKIPCVEDKRRFAGFSITGNAGNKAVVLSRSKRRLEQQGYIKREWSLDKSLNKYVPMIVLTDAGSRRAEEILSTEPVERF